MAACYDDDIYIHVFTKLNFDNVYEMATHRELSKPAECVTCSRDVYKLTGLTIHSNRGDLSYLKLPVLSSNISVYVIMKIENLFFSST